MFLVVQFRCFLVTKSFAFSLIPPTFIHTLSPSWGPQWNSSPDMVGISCCSVGTLLAVEVGGKCNSQHLIIGSCIAHTVAALKFLKDLFSSALSVAKIGSNQRNQRYLCRIFPVPYPILLWALAGAWGNLEILFLTNSHRCLWNAASSPAWEELCTMSSFKLLNR